MKEFNLEAWKAGAKVQTRDGREVKQLTFFEECKDNSECFSGIVDGILRAWDINGKLFRKDWEQINLVMSPVKRVVKFCCHSNGNNYCINDKETAEVALNDGYKIHTVEVEE